MAAFAYQSFESTSSHTHDARAIFQQKFTRATNERVTGEGVEALVPPSNPDMPSEIYSGPAQKMEVAELDRGITPTIAFLQQHISLMFRNAYSSMGQHLNAFVCGELDANGTDFNPLRSLPNLDTHVLGSDKNSQCFTGFVPKGDAGTTRPITGGPGYYAFTIEGMTVVFVHVPNAIRDDKDGAFAFYSKIQSDLAKASAPGIDIVMGDTNQQKADFTRERLLQLKGGTFANAMSGSSVSPVDNYLYTTKGTNSMGDQLYDVCVYNSDRVAIDDIAYLSQSSSGKTVTDHMGVIVKAHLK